MREKLRAKWSTRYSYISHKPCGCLAMVVIDNPVHRKEVAIEVARAIQRGERIKRVTTISVKKMDWLCPKHRLEEVLDSSQPFCQRTVDTRGYFAETFGVLMSDKVKVHRSHISSKIAKARGWTRPLKIKRKRKGKADKDYPGSNE